MFQRGMKVRRKTIFDPLLNIKENLVGFAYNQSINIYSLLISTVFLHKALDIFAETRHFLK